LGNSNGRFGALTRFEEGTIAPLVAIYLSIILLAVIGSVAVITALIASNRVQGVAEMAILYAHDRAVIAGVPSQAELSRQVALFLRAAPSAERLVIVSASAQVSADTSTLRLCARYQNPLGIGLNSAIICRESKAKSFLIP
jgi:hypothetical protein